MSFIELENITKIYTPNKHVNVKALNNVSLKLENEKSYAIIGASGSGKSTLLNILACLLTVTAGTYKIGEQEITGLSVKTLCKLRNEKIGIVVQDFALIEGSTVEENILMPAILAGQRIKTAKNKAVNIMEELGILELRSLKVFCLSGGQRQRVAIARALINSPSLILADEPTGALDSQTAQIVMDMLLETRKKGVTVVIATHNLTYAQQCDSQIQLHDGNII